VAAVISLIAVISIAVWRSIWGVGEEQTGARWLGTGLVWTALALTFLAPSLAVVIRGLPNDHYHAFADPMVFVLVGIGAAALWRLVPRHIRARAGPVEPAGGGSVPHRPLGPGTGGTAPEQAVEPRPRAATLRQPEDPGVPPLATADGLPTTSARGATPGRLIALVGVGALVAWAATHVPAPIHPDGGFPAALAAAQRIEAAAGPGPIELRSLPVFKSIEAYAYPLVLGGRTLHPGAEISQATMVRDDAAPSDPGTLVVVCDSLFEPVLGAPCGGSAESAIVPAGTGELLERFEAAPGRVISVYRVEAR
jgi:hypothetical protein